MRALLLILTAALSAAGCGDDDAVPRMDAGPPPDGSTALDAGPRQDAPAADAPAGDAGPTLAPVDGPGRLALGAEHTCHVRDDGSLWCWGRNDRGQLGNGPGAPSAVPVRVGTSSDWIMVTAEGDATCGLRGPGALYCLRPAGTPERIGTDLWRWIDVGEAFFAQPFCGVRQDGALFCWTTGDPERVGTGTDWERVAAGDDRHCAMQTDGSVWCWDPSMPPATPARVGADVYAWYDVGQHWGCGATRDGRLLCSGSFLPTFPTTPPGGGAFTSTGVGFGQGCAVIDDGRVLCSGTNWRGEAGRPIGASGDPIAFGTGLVEVATGERHTCARRADDSVACWGGNLYGQLGTGETGLRTAPVRVGTDADWDRVACGSDYTCGLRAGNLLCWGNLSFGAMFETVVLAPTSFDASGTWAELSAGSQACGIRTDGSLWCWGRNGFGQVGDGTTRDRGAPVRIGSSVAWTHVTTAFSHTCGVDAGLLSCWGRNNNGQLGVGGTSDRSSPTAVGTATWTSVSAGGQASCGVQTDGSLHCWGSLSVGTSEQRPLRIGTGVDWDEASVAESSVTPNRCALRTDGTVECVGTNADGQLGDGTTTSRTDYAPAMGGPWASVSAGTGYVCALARDGALFCWGASELGQTALGGVASVSVPTRVGTDTWRELSVGARHACAIRADGALFCWGANDLGELGSGTPFSSDPVEVAR